jgi:glycosyltransferase involved in cell wall biosynthesis
MPTFYGLLRVKNESRWIERTLRSLQPVCKVLFVFDDHSTDGTPDLCDNLGAMVIPSPFEGLNETRDKNHLQEALYREVGPFRPGQDWALMIDGDEIIETGGTEGLQQCAASGRDAAYNFQIIYLWDREDLRRTDGVYGRFRRPSMYPLGLQPAPFRDTTQWGNFHCGSVPAKYFGGSYPVADVRLLHYGYIERGQRLHKWDWYNSIDPHNVIEDQYRHMIQGDVTSRACPFCKAQNRSHVLSIPDVRLNHAGPLKLEPYDAKPNTH